MSIIARADRIKGVLLGQAAGDALGAGYEAGRQPENGIAAMVGGGFGFEPGEWTDDTGQAVIVALAKGDPAAAADGLLGWYRSRPKDIGGTTRSVLSTADRAMRTDIPREALSVMRRAARQAAGFAAARPAVPGWDPGMANGSLMRTGPACLPFLGDRAKVAVVAREVSDLTHADPYAGDACVLWSLAIQHAICWGLAVEAYRRRPYPVILDMRGGLVWLPGERREFWAGAINQVATASSGEEFRRNGSAVGAFKAALHAVAHAGSLEDGLQKAVAIGGDTDTVAAIAGALLGAIHGASAVPQEWRAVLHGWSPSGVIKAEDLERIALEAAP